jgi:hypothetical protein
VCLKTYRRRCGAHISPHQLRHSCATLLLNAGAPVISVQALLGHEKVDTTLGYARLYDGTLAADYYRAMGQIERLFGLVESGNAPARLIALVDSIGSGMLNITQREMLQFLREGILSLAVVEQRKYEVCKCKGGIKPLFLFHISMLFIIPSTPKDMKAA